MSLFLPPHIAAEKRREFAAEILKRVDLQDRRALEFTATLQLMDPRLIMVKARDPIAPGTPLRPGFYHVLRRNENAPMTVIPITENDCYVEPDSRVYTKLAESNMTQRRVMKDIERQDRIVEQAVQRENERAKDERKAELKERVLAVTRAQVSMSRDMPWSQNSAGRRGVKS